MRRLIATCGIVVGLLLSRTLAQSEQVQPSKPNTLAPKTDVQQVDEPTTTERDKPFIVDDQIPDFRLRDQADQERTLTELLAKGRVALVFYRSADW